MLADYDRKIEATLGHRGAILGRLMARRRILSLSDQQYQHSDQLRRS